MDTPNKWQYNKWSYIFFPHNFIVICLKGKMQNQIQIKPYERFTVQ